MAFAERITAHNPAQYALLVGFFFLLVADMELTPGLILGLIVVAVMYLADRRRNKSYKDYLKRKREGCDL